MHFTAVRSVWEGRQVPGSAVSVSPLNLLLHCSGAVQQVVVCCVYVDQEPVEFSRTLLSSTVTIAELIFVHELKEMQKRL